MPRFPKGVHLKGGRNAAPVLAAMAREFYAPLIPIVMELREQGLSLRAIARELEKRGIMSRLTWPRWSAAQVRRVVIRAAGGIPDPRPARVEPAARPPGADFDLWIDNEVCGPFTIEQVKAMLDCRKITLHVLFMRVGVDEWSKVGTLFGRSDRKP
jgi:hypothetical protein